MDRVPAAVVRPGQIKGVEAEDEVVADRTHDAVLAVEVGRVGRGITRRHHLRDGFAAHEDCAATGCWIRIQQLLALSHVQGVPTEFYSKN